MKATKHLLAAVFGFVALVAPRGLWADNIATVAVSGITFDGNSVCGSSGTAVCTETLSASFQWDNSTNTYVGGSFSSTESGALGSSFTLFGPELYYNSSTVSFFLLDTNGDDLFVSLSEGASGLVAGAYTGEYDVAVPGTPPGEFSADLECGGSPSVCSTDYSPEGPYSTGGAADLTVGSVVVTTPEPSSAVCLLCAGFLWLIGMGLQAKRLA